MRIVLFISIILSCLSCSTEPDFHLVPYEPKLVIDGSIENGGFPIVILGKSISYFDKIDSSTVRDLVVTTAKITVSDGTQSEILTLKKDNRYFPPYVYTGTLIKGEAGKSYQLTVESKGEVYTATTTIPQPVALNNLWFTVIEGKDSLGYLYARIKDNPDQENFYRIFTQRENKDKRYIPVYLSAIADQSFNGKDFTFSLLRGPENYNNVVDDLYYEAGDTVLVKFCSMDRAHFDFWRTLERELYVIGNPFSSSGNQIISNVKGRNALGIWGGYGVNYYKIITKK